MANENKSEKAGATTPANPSTIEGTQSTDQGKLDLGVNTSTSEENDNLKAELEAKDVEIEALKAEHKEFKDKLKPEIEKIQEENKSLKAKNVKLQASLDKASVKSKAKKEDPKFIVINAFRGNKEGEGIFELGADVSHFDSERLESLVERELVKKV